MFVRREITMPYKPFKPCAHSGCAKLVPPGEMYCERHKAMHPKPTYERASAYARGYTKRWQQEREVFLEAHPLCEECMKHGLYVKATDVDHITPHRGDESLFWDVNNLQALCHSCHSKKTAREDRAYAKEHPWKK